MNHMYMIQTLQIRRTLQFGIEIFLKSSIFQKIVKNLRKSISIRSCENIFSFE